MVYKLSDFEMIGKIGQGTYGTVYKAENKITKKLSAIKEFLTPEEDDGIPSTSLREVSILKELQHPYIICLEQTMIECGKLWLVFEYMDMDLRKYMVTIEGPVNRPLVKRFTYQVMQGLLFCHSRRIIHRDLKPDNFLVNKETKIIKIADFGMARTFSAPAKIWTREVVTQWYRAPEIMLSIQRYSCAIDVWAMGCIVLEMCLNKPIFDGDSEIDQLFAIFQILGTPNDDIWPNVTKMKGWMKVFPIWKNIFRKKLKNKVDEKCIDLMEKMLTYCPTDRPSVREALSHEYFDDLDKSDLPFIDLEKRLDPMNIIKSFARQN